VRTPLPNPRGLAAEPLPLLVTIEPAIERRPPTPLMAALRKELLLQWRTRGQFMAVFVFGAAALLLFSFAIGPNAIALRTFSGGFLWLGLLLSSTLTLAESFHGEMENRALEGLLLLPSDARALYYAKAIANWLQLTILGIALVPVMVVLYDAGTIRLPLLLLVIVLGAAGLSAPGTLYAAMTAQLQAKQTLLPLLLFPLIVPALLASVKATSLVVLGDPMGELKPWLVLLLAFDLIYWSLCGLLYARVVDE
jgi:heme exporter protein B